VEASRIGRALVVRVSLKRTSQCPERFELVRRKTARFREHSIERRSRMSLAQDKPVALLPARVPGIVSHLMEEQDSEQISHGERSPGMARAGLSDHPDDPFSYRHGFLKQFLY